MHAQKLDEKCDAYKLWVIRLEMKLLLQMTLQVWVYICYDGETYNCFY
jgi:hypothetical protein